MALLLPQQRSRKPYVWKNGRRVPHLEGQPGEPTPSPAAASVEDPFELPAGLLLYDFHICPDCRGAVVEDAVTRALTCTSPACAHVFNVGATVSDAVPRVRKGVYKRERYFLSLLREAQGQGRNVPREVVDSVRRRLRLRGLPVNAHTVKLALRETKHRGWYRERWAVVRVLCPSIKWRLTTDQELSAVLLFSRVMRVWDQLITDRLSAPNYPFVLERVLSALGLLPPASVWRAPELKTLSKTLATHRWWQIIVSSGRVDYRGIQTYGGLPPSRCPS